MKHQRYFIFLFGLILYVSLWGYGKQHRYDWDKVDEKVLNERQPPDKVMDALGVRQGMKVGEVGAGGGRYAVKMAERVGPSGKVYANDIAQNAIEYMRSRCNKNKIQNIVVILGTETESNFPIGKLDLVYMTFTYRHLSKPLPVLKNIIQTLKKNGSLAIIESKPNGSRQSEKKMINIAEQAGFKLERIETFLPMDNIWVFKVPE